MNASVSMTHKKKKEEVFCQRAVAALNGTNCLSVPSGRSKGLTLLSVFTCLAFPLTKSQKSLYEADMNEQQARTGFQLSWAQTLQFRQ